MWHFSDGMGWWTMLVWMVIFWAAIIALFVWGITKLSRRGDITLKQSSLDLAKQRYARGEITREELEQLKKDLT